MSTIHPTAMVSPGAQIAAAVEIGPNVIIDEHVTIGSGTKIYANAYLTGYTTIGCNNEIHMGAVIGHEPQDLGFSKDTVSYVEIGDNNVIREYVTIHRGTKPDSKTTMGNSNFLMGGSHLAHNVTVGSNVIIANYACLAGHVSVADRAFVSGGVMVHQFVTVGRFAMLSGNGRFSRDIPPFLVALERNRVEGLQPCGPAAGRAFTRNHTRNQRMPTKSCISLAMVKRRLSRPLMRQDSSRRRRQNSSLS